MKPKTMVLMVVAVGCGLVASYMTSRLIADRGQASTDPKIKILVTKKKVNPLTLITKPEDLFIEKEVSPENLPKKVITKFEDLKDKRLNKAVGEDSYVTTDDLVSKDLQGLAATLKPGSRAIAIRVNPESLVGGFVLPNSRVDVVATTNDGEAASQIMLQDMLVLAVDMQSNRNPDGQTTMLGSTVTLAALPEEATRLALAQRLGELRLLLRAIGDEGVQIRTRASKKDHLNKPIAGTADQALTDTMLAQGSVTPRIPDDLPPVAQTTAQNPMTEPEPETFKTHTMVIRSGDTVQMSRFIQEKDGSWKQPTVRGDVEEQPKTPKDRPTWPKATPPTEKSSEVPGGRKDSPAQPKSLEAKLLESSGLPPVKQQQ